MPGTELRSHLVRRRALSAAAWAVMLGLLGAPMLLLLRALWTDPSAGSTLVWTIVMGAGALGAILAAGPERPTAFVAERVYRRLGVRAFARALRVFTADQHTSGTRRHLRETLASPQSRAAWVARTRANERGHLLWLGAALGATLAAIALHRWGLALWLAGANLFVNAYPVLLQRYTRIRLGRFRG